MRLIFFIYLISQLFNFLDVFAQKIKEESSKLNSIEWEKVLEKKSKPLKKIIWRSYKNDESYFKDEIFENRLEESFSDTQKKKKKFVKHKKTYQELLQIQPHIPLNNFLDSGDFIFSTYWKSSFSGGAGGGTGKTEQINHSGLHHASLKPIKLESSSVIFSKICLIYSAS